MKICRFKPNRVGVVIADEVTDVTDIVSAHIALHWPAPLEDPFIARMAVLLPLIEKALPSAPRRSLSDVELLSPVANPPKLVAAPVNYKKHFDESIADAEIHANSAVKQIEVAGLFLKSSTSLIGASQTVNIRFPERRNDHEIELAVIIGRHAHNVPVERALDYVAGYTIGLDMTVRGPEDRSFRKSPDTYSVLGPWMVTPDEFGDPGEVDLQLHVNDEPRQTANTRDLIMSVPALIAFATKWYSLVPGDVLFTGTPEGVGPVVAGDEIRAEIARIGAMRVKVGNS